MNSSDADRQIKQMVNFILQEAEEKSREIRIKTEHDFNLEKQMLVHNAKLKIQEEYARKEKEREINKRIALSAEIGASRKKKMIAREELLQQLMTLAKDKCSETSKDKAKYKELMKNLIAQGLIKMYETSVMVRCRAQDKAIVESVLSDAKKLYIDIMKKEVNDDVTVDLQIETNPKLMIPQESAGGVVLTGLNGKIMCDNTLDTRLMHVNYDLKPKIRTMLFPIV